MKCPLDGAELRMTERQGIEIDYCPTCRGVWLDRGELDKLIDRAQTASFAGPQQPYAEQRSYGRPHKRRKSFLQEMFDFD